jgi:tetratricopeptide (TPR) repeat protein
MENEESLNGYEAIVLRYNKVAMNYLKFNNLKDSLVLLKKADEILNSNEDINIPNRLKLIGITLNNLGCYYKKRKQPKVALSYLKRALEVESQTKSDEINIASSHLNMCAIFSSLSKHQKALHHSKQSLKILQSLYETEGYNYKKSITLVTTLVISYYNTAVEYEFLHKYIEAYNHFEKGCEIADSELGLMHPMSINLHAVINKFNSNYKQRTSKSTFRNAKSTLCEVEGFDRDKLPSVGPANRNFSLINYRVSTAFDKAFDGIFRNK